MDRAELSGRLGGGTLRHGGSDTVICEEDPARFHAAFSTAAASGGRVFLADPAWRESERAEFNAILSAASTDGPPEGGAERGWLCLPTGGSSGRIKLARHDAATVAAAVAGFTRHFGVTRVDAVGFLPLHHVSGLMAWLRALLTGGRYQAARWCDVARGLYPMPPSQESFVSIVPTQLQRLLTDASAVDWLRSFRAVFVGGGPVWPELLDRATAARLPLSLSYGMTETAAMVSALLPEEFAAGRRSAGRALPHARIEVNAEGVLRVEGASLFRGYFPHWRDEGDGFTTADLGSLDAEGHVHIQRRLDEVIITGGEKVDPRGVEEVLRASGQFSDVAVIGLPDPAWGQSVVACYPADAEPADWEGLRAWVERELSGYRRPKRYVAVTPWPRNAQGKLNREALRAAAGRT